MARMHGFRCAAVVMLAVSCAASHPPELDLAFDEATRRAALVASDPYVGEAQPGISAAHRRSLVVCPVMTDLQVDVVLAVSEAGRVERVFVRPDNSRTRCLGRALRRAKLPPPPSAPFFISWTFLWSWQ